MSRYIDAEPLIRFIQDARRALPVESKDFYTRDEMLLNFEQYVNLAPTADVAEVIRCKECKWWRPSPRGNYGDCILLFDRYTEDCESCFDAETECDGFCEKGERKMDGGVING